MIKVCPVLKDTNDSTYELTKLVSMSPKRDAKLHSIQAENNSSSSNDHGMFIDGTHHKSVLS